MANDLHLSSPYPILTWIKYRLGHPGIVSYVPSIAIIPLQMFIPHFYKHLAAAISPKQLRNVMIIG